MSRIPTVDAARRLKTHPANLVLRLSRMVGSLADCWPYVEEGLVETIEQMEGRPALRSDQPPLDVSQEPTAPSRHDPLQDAKLRVLDKLARQDKWGGNPVSWDTLRNHYCRGVDKLDEAVESLVETDLLLAPDKRRGPFSLNPARKREIEHDIAKGRGK